MCSHAKKNRDAPYLRQQSDGHSRGPNRRACSARKQAQGHSLTRVATEWRGWRAAEAHVAEPVGRKCPANSGNTFDADGRLRT